jgi:TolB-like protein
MDQPEPARVLRFDGFTLDGARGSLRGPDGADIPLAPKPFDLLLVLARDAGRTLSKDALLAAVWRGVHVSEDSLFQAVREARRALGDETGKVLRSVPRRGYMLDVDVDVAAPPAVSVLQPAPLMPPASGPSLVVLPFRNLGDDKTQGYFADAIVQDITAALARVRWLFVIASGSALTYKGRVVDLREVGRELGVRYALEGSVRRADNQLRFTCHLVETETRRQLWAERFEGDLSDVFALQDQLLDAVAGAIEPNLRQAEVERARQKTTDRLDAYDLYLRALAVNDRFTRESVMTMRQLCELSIELDPNFTRSYGLASRAHIQMHSQGWLDTKPSALRDALSFVERGLLTDPHDALMLTEAGHAFAFFGRNLDQSIAYLDEAVAARTHLIEPLLRSGIIRQRIGQTRLAIEHLHRALRLSPLDTRRYAIFGAIAAAHMCDREFETAYDWATRATQQNPNYLPGWRVLASAAAYLGRMADARSGVAHMRAIRPGLTIKSYEEGRAPIRADLAAIDAEGLRRAGLPE